ncbi:cupin domain-containing protein [Thioclava sp. FR2]|uniref:cupin domain-containing protein n=1 Tax=Thioclava sp. FR2 TaxID=3445780 RepID=UPI003EBCF395
MKDFANDVEAMRWNGTFYKTILSTAETGGAMSIVDSLSPVNSGPPRHIHHAEDEVLMILTGRCLFWMEGEEFIRGPGEVAFIPRGKEHTFRVISDVPCRHLIILTPGGFEGFFADMAQGQFAIPADMPAVVESASRHNLTFTGPPLE